MSLEHVAHGQTRFFTPGLAPDERGILLGRYCLLTFPTLEGAVSWLRLYSSEASLDELLASLSIAKVKTALGSREVVIQIPALSSYGADRAARLARLVGGATYTGTAKHYVKYRDDRSPYGYDAIDIGPLPPATDFVVHGDEFSQGYTREGDLAFDRLLYRLSIRKIPGGANLSAEDRSDLLVAVAHGLTDGMIRYLWRNRVAATAGVFAPRVTSAFDDARDRGYMVIRVRNLPERMLALFLATPGVDVFRPAGANAAIAVGYKHPIDLASCQSVFPSDAFHLFWPNDRVDVLPGPLTLSDIAGLTRLDIELDRPNDSAGSAGARSTPDQGVRRSIDSAGSAGARSTPDQGVRRSIDSAGSSVDRGEFSASAPNPIAVDLRLAPSIAPPRRVVATLIARKYADRLKRLLFALPSLSLRGHRVAVTDRGILVIGAANFDVIPLGQLLCELAPGLLIPLGMDAVPRVSAEVLARALGHGPSVVTVLAADGRPFQIPEAGLVTLERRALARLDVEAVPVESFGVDPPADVRVVNDPVGRFALWGFPDVPDRKQLPSGSGEDGNSA